MGTNRAEYMRQYRTTPAGRAAIDAQNARSRAKNRAIRRMIERYTSEFENLFIEELRKEFESN